MKIIPKTNCHNQSQISFSHTPVKTDKQYVKYVTKSSIFPELYLSENAGMDKET